jgi:hypothetical protein
MGQSYNPTAFLGCDNTVALMKYIWNNRLQPSHTVISSIKHLPEYKTLKQNTFSAGACSIVDRELFNMIADAKAFDDPPYEVFPNSDTGAEPQMSVGYKLLDGMTTDVHYGMPAFISCAIATAITEILSSQGTKLRSLGFSKLKRKLYQCKLPRNNSNSKFRAVASLMQAFQRIILIVFWASLVLYLVLQQTSANSFS